MTDVAPPPRSFCLIRHGETTANADGCIAGRTDVALTERGEIVSHEWNGRLTLWRPSAGK